MNYRIVHHRKECYLECMPDGGLLESEACALDLMAACGVNRTHRLLLHQQNLPQDFFRLSSGLAGAVLQKFVTYRLRVAVVIEPELASEGRFGEMVYEANRGNQFHVAGTHIEAEAWLLRDAV